MADGRKGEFFYDSHESAKAGADDAQNLKRNVRVRKAKRLKVLLADKEQRGIIDGRDRSRIIAPIKYREFRNGTSGPSMLNTCSRPLIDLLKIRICPDSTT